MNSKPEKPNMQFLWLIRHGKSTSNIARQKAEAKKLPTIDFPGREPGCAALEFRHYAGDFNRSLV